MFDELDFPPSIDLARLPTPLEPLERLSERLGLQLICKRDDLTGTTLTGNKVRKLEFLLAASLDAGFAGVVTCGGEQSNHARATALACARLGLDAHLLLRTADPAHPPVASGNLLLGRLAGASVEWITAEQYRERDALMAVAAERLQQQSGDRYDVIPEGGSNALGAWGYVRCAQELAHQLGRVAATVVYPVGSGGTAAGLIAGCRLLDLPYRLVGVCVSDDRRSFQQRIAAILRRFAERWKLDVASDAEDIELWDGYVGLGYARSRREELACIADLAQTEGLVLDPVYTGKAMFGLLSELAAGRLLGEPIVFMHTGGVFGLEAQARQLEALL